MPKKSSVGSQRANLADWLRLQQLVVDRTSQYVENMSQLTAEGSLEPREYIERSTKYWADLIGDVGDWLQPTSGVEPAKVAPRRRERIEVRLQSRPVSLPIPYEVFGSLDPTKEFLLAIDGFARQAKPRAPLRPSLTLTPRTHFNLVPEVVKREHRRRIELKIHNLPDNLAPGDIYEGGLWATPLTADVESLRGLIAIIELEIT